MFCQKDRFVLFVMVLAPLVFPMPSAWADVLIGRVVSIADGDTLTILEDGRKQHKIRLAGIDAPERAQPFGKRSKEHLSSLVFDRRVIIETDKKDRYRRTVGKVIIDGRDANLAMVESGFAWHYKKYELEQALADRLLYADAEREARKMQRGLWIEPAALAPWDWRRNKKAVGER